MRKFGIDVSRWQGDFDFKRAKEKEGVQFAILKIGGGDAGLYKDSKFDANYKKCVECGLDKGVYFFGHAMNIEQAKKEAAYIISLLKGLKLEYPVWYDVEGDMVTLNKRLLTDIVKTVLKTVQNAGYWVGLYGSATYLHTQVFDEELKGYSHWGASWTKTKPTYKSGAQLQMWQFGGEVNCLRSTKINGQTVDQDYCYVDYPTLIKNKGLNGFKKPTATKPTQTVTAAQTIKKGDKVKVTKAVQYDGKPFKVYYSNYNVMEVKGDRAVIGVNGVVTAAINVKNIKKV